MKKAACIISLLCVVTANYAQKRSTPDTRLAGLDAELQKVLEVWKTPGFAVAVVEKNKVVYAKGFGYRDYEKKIPVTPNTLFAIGSCSKAFTSAILGQLRQEGKLSLDDSPRKYIPELRFYNDAMNASITLKDLMSHRTGLPRHDFSWYLFPSNSKDSLIGRVAYQQPFASVRERWYYNNFMFLAQGVVAERISGKSWEQNVRDRIFKPLGMSRSNLSIDELTRTEDVAFGYELKNETTIRKMDYYHIAGMSPAGSINSSVNEMAPWLMTWIYGGKYNGAEVLPAAYVNEAISSQMVAGAGMPDKDTPDVHLSNYGYGWFLASYKGHYRVEHGGNIDGFSANTSFFPSDSVGIVVLVNQNGSTVPGVVRNIIADRMLKLSKTDWNTLQKTRREKALKEQQVAAKQKSSSQVKGTRPSHSMLEFTGRYSHPGYGVFDLVLERDSLFAKFKLEKVWLRHYHYDVFEAFNVTDSKVDTMEAIQVRFNFFTNESGDINRAAIKFEPVLDPIEFKREPLITAVSAEDLAALVGDYELGGMVAKFYLKGQTLHLTVPGQPEYELIPIGNNKFSIRNLDGFKIEFVKAGTTSSEAIFVQPSGTFRAKRK